jgi:hypothetical protein
MTTAPTLSYIESDFAHVHETAREFRLRTAQPRPRRIRRLFALA